MDVHSNPPIYGSGADVDELDERHVIYLFSQTLFHCFSILNVLRGVPAVWVHTMQAIVGRTFALISLFHIFLSLYCDNPIKAK